jgi:hypothetical protein
LFGENHAVFAHIVVEEILGGFEVTIASILAEARRRVAAGSFEAVLVHPSVPSGRHGPRPRREEGRPKGAVRRDPAGAGGVGAATTTS